MPLPPSIRIAWIACRPISIVSASLRGKSQEWDLHVIFRSRLRIDTFPEDFAKSTESNFSRVFKTRSPMGVNEEFSLSSLATDPLDGSIVYSTWRFRIHIYIYIYIYMQKILETRNERISFAARLSHGRWWARASTWQALSSSKTTADNYCYYRESSFRGYESSTCICRTGNAIQSRWKQKLF